jgi:hypothetical protein
MFEQGMKDYREGRGAGPFATAKELQAYLDTLKSSMRVHFAPLSPTIALPKIQKAADEQFALLRENLRHPSLRAKKYDERLDEWQARVSRGYRLKRHGL